MRPGLATSVDECERDCVADSGYTPARGDERRALSVLQRFWRMREMRWRGHGTAFEMRYVHGKRSLPCLRRQVAARRTD